MLYMGYEVHSQLLAPLRVLAQELDAALRRHRPQRAVLRKIAAACELIAQLRLTHSRPAFGIDCATVGGRPVAISEEAVLTLPFGTLLHFRKDAAAAVPTQPPVLVVAPLSGHFATLLRETVRTMLQDHDVYITDWHNARDVSVSHGDFGFDDYIGYLMRYIATVGPGCHVIAV